MNDLILALIAAVVPFGTLVYVLVSVRSMQDKIADAIGDMPEPVVSRAPQNGNGKNGRRSTRTRALCWTCAFMVFGWGVTLAMPGNTLESFPAYALLATRLSEGTWAAVLITIGVARFIALIVDYRVRYQSGALVRCAASFAGVLVWSQFIASFVNYSMNMGALSPGFTVYLVLVGADLYSTGRAMQDWMKAT